MNTNSRHDSKVKKGVIRWLVRETFGNLVLIAILFGIVGRWDWWMGWNFPNYPILGALILTPLSMVFIGIYLGWLYLRSKSIWMPTLAHSAFNLTATLLFGELVMQRDDIFLHRTDVPADNNACERALRPSVIHRKVMGSFRSDWRAQAYAALATVLNTAKRNGENAFQKLVRLMGTLVLPFLLQLDFV